MNAVSRSLLRLHIAFGVAVERVREERGAAMTEYGMLITVVAVGCLLVLMFFGREVVNLFTDAEDQLDTLPGVPPAD